MAKPDWGELQQRFLSEHAITRELHEVDYG